MTMTEGQWEKHWGFHVFSPFAYTSAEREQDISKYFFEPVFWPDLLRNVSHVIHGPWGSGKTAVCKKLYAALADRGSLGYPRPLIIPLVHFDDLRHVENLTPDVCLDRIITNGFSQFIKLLRKHATVQRAIALDEWRMILAGLLSHHRGASPQAYVDDIIFFYRFRPGNRLFRWLGLRSLKTRLTISRNVRRLTKMPLSLGENTKTYHVLGRVIAQILGETDDSVISHDPTVRFSLLHTAARLLGYEQITVLVDHIDNLTGENTNYKLMAKILDPFFDLAALHLHGMSNLTFKFHVPTQLLAHSSFRRDKLETHELLWSDSQMMKMLEARLKYCSFGAQTLDALVPNERKIFESILLAFSAGLPRNMYRLLRYAQLACMDQFESKQRYHLQVDDLLDGVRTFFERERGSSWIRAHAEVAEHRLQQFFHGNWERYSVHRKILSISSEHVIAAT